MAVAQTNTVNAADTATNTLKVSPVRTDITVQPGTSKTVKTTVTNLTDETIKVRPVENDFVAGDERGTPALILDADEYAPSHSLKRFMKPLNPITIPANESRTIEVVITVPQDAKAGGYFGAVRFAPVSPDEGGQVNLSASVASLILMKVPGDLTEKLKLTDFDVQQNGKTAAYFDGSDNLQLYVRFENEGNVQVGPFGKVSVKRGDEVVYETDFNTQDQRDMVLPGSARRWEVPLKDIGGFGHYTVTATFTYGKDNQTIEASKSFWVIPQTVIIAVVVGLLVLAAVVAGIWWFLRSYKKRVIRNHSNNQQNQ